MTKTALIALILVSINSYSEEKTALLDDSAYKHTCDTNFNDEFVLSEYSDDWFQVYKTNKNVYSIVEPYQYQESISHLIIGQNKAILLDTGIGLFRIRPVVEQIT
ncbi:MAG: hypothetical protein P8L74_04115, partial [Gammaproteobacteria bacterium]|nr:hypothetical protein [Gammaproteobacteria bacterium]